jgi:exonuclease VII large subunit
MSNVVTKTELKEALRAQTDDLSQVMAGFVEQVDIRFNELEQKLDSKASQTSIDTLQRTIDRFVNRLDEQEIELRSRDNQFDKLLEWAQKVSEKTGIPLENL